MNKLVLDAGALIAIDRNDRRVVALLARSRPNEIGLAIPAGVVGQAWRDGRRQARLARFLSAPDVEVVPLDDARARAAGQLCGASGTNDVIDASVALCARDRGRAVLTSDARDLLRIDPTLEIERV